MDEQQPASYDEHHAAILTRLALAEKVVEAARTLCDSANRIYEEPAAESQDDDFKTTHEASNRLAHDLGDCEHALAAYDKEAKP